MVATIFFSWQSDLATSDGRNFIERALEIAAKNVSQEIELQTALRDGLEIDKDTQNVPGSPKIFETILDKIERATIFVPDLTFVAERPNGDPTPNPNVLIEYGYALKCKDSRQFIAVMNISYGEPNRNTMPFDLIQYRNPITFDLPQNADEEVRKTQRAQLVRKFESALRTFFDSDFYKAGISRPQLVHYRQPLDGEARFRPKGKPIGYGADPVAAIVGGKDSPVFLKDGPAMWLRVAPSTSIQKSFKIAELTKRLPALIVLPIFELGESPIYVRDADGCGYARLGDGHSWMAVFVFKDAEVWAINTWFLSYTPALIILDQERFAKSLKECARFISGLGIPGPYRWIAGFEGVAGRSVARPGTFQGSRGPCTENVIKAEGTFNIGDDALEALQPLFEDVLEKCGIT